MYEFKNRSVEVKKGDFQFLRLEDFALMTFHECPKLLTLATHTNLMDVTPIHCYQAKTGSVIDFTVEKQDFLFRVSKTGLRFSVIKVFDEEKKSHWLVACENNRKGFLLPGYFLNRFAKREKYKKALQRKIVH